MRTPLPIALGLVLVTLAACGGNGAAVLEWDSGGAAGAGGGSVVVTQRSAVVAADIDGDGAGDLVALGREGAGPGLLWRGVRGRFVPAPTGWRDLPALRALQDDADGRADADLAPPLGFHAAACASRPDLGYAVLHLADGAGAAPAGPPTVEEVVPAEGFAGTPVALLGTGLAARGETTTVAFGGVEAQVLFAFPDAVFAVVPDALGPGATTVRVTRAGGQSEAAAFEVLVRPVPTVRSVEPSTLAPGALAVLHGTGLGTPADEVTVAFTGASPARALGLLDAALVVVPRGATSGPMTVSVAGLSSAPFEVSVGSLPAPRVRAVEPAAASPGSIVRIEGDDLLPFDGGIEVTFAGARAALFGVARDGLLAIVPPGAVSGDLVVSAGGRASAGTPFRVLARGAPVIASADPAEGAVGTRIEILGTDLSDLSAWRPGRLPPRPPFGDLRVAFGGVETPFVLPTSSGLVAVVPRGAVTGDLVVTLDGQASNAVPFVVR